MFWFLAVSWTDGATVGAAQAGASMRVLLLGLGELLIVKKREKRSSGASVKQYQGKVLTLNESGR